MKVEDLIRGVMVQPRDVEKSFTYDGISQGNPLGKLTLTGQGVPNLDVPLLTADDVSQLSLPDRAMTVLTKYVSGT